jgi:hypothetical protein
MEGVTAAVAKRDACMAKHAPGLQKDMVKRGETLKKAAIAIALGSGTPGAKKAKLKKLMEKHLDDGEQYRAALVSKCMGDVAATLREMSKLVQAVCNRDNSNKLCKNSAAVLAARKKADSDNFKPKDMRALEKKMSGL